MKLYPIPGGGWAGTEADWKREMKAAGYDPKQFEQTKTREVPTGKKELMEFLIFHGVDVYRLPAGTTVSTTPVDVDALRREHNPDAPDLPPATPPAPPKVDTFDLDETFAAAPLGQQLRLAVVAIDAAHAKLNAPST